MLDAPRQDWTLYESMSRESDAAWIRGLTLADRFAIYADLFNIIWEARHKSGVGANFNDRHWRQQVETRQRLAHAFAQWDQRRERAAAENAG